MRCLTPLSCFRSVSKKIGLVTGSLVYTKDFEEFLYIVLKMLSYDEIKNEIMAEQVGTVIGPNSILSFQEREGDVFDPVYFIVLENLGEKIEDMEDELVTNPSPETLQKIHILKRKTIFLRKSVWPLREVVDGLDRKETRHIRKTTHIYLRDVYDHTIQIIDTAETFRDLIAGMLDIYLSSISNKTNNVMKVLTIIATIFMPLTFIAGIYGMNFKYMPELEWRWSYPIVWGIMIFIAASMICYFIRKDWL